MDSGYSPDTVLGTCDNEVYEIINPIFPYFLYYKGEKQDQVMRDYALSRD